MINTGQHLIEAKPKKDLVDIKLRHRKKEEIDYVKVIVEAEEKICYPEVEISWKHPIVNIQSCWHPGTFRDKGLEPDWGAGFSAKATSLAPVISFYSIDNRNQLAVAYSRALETVEFKMGVHEETGDLDCKIILFTQPSKKRNYYEAEIRIDTRDIPYYTAIKEISNWYETIDGYEPTQVPQEAKMPMYSTWYSFHQEITAEEIEKQCKIARELGCKAVIVDDGWQTNDNNRGYAYCGDWEVSPDRIDDMRKHVKKVHDLGMKYLLWYSVPFVGVHSKAWSRFKDKLLFHAEDRGAGVLDPRYPEVRDYLINTYKGAVKNWDLDGLKLDFVDQFDLKNASQEDFKKDNRRDFKSLQEAVDKLLTDTIECLKKVKPDIMIEFRQKYIGPYMRKYGNIFRVNDCPNDPITNRVGTIDLRLSSGDTAVHSDMVMWSPEDTVENASLQLINILFSVPQFSMRFDELSKEHFEMSKFWLGFWKKHKDLLLNGKLKPLSPENMYPVISTENESKRLIVVYENMVVKSGINIPEKFIIVNGTLEEEVILDLEEELKDRKLKVYDCCGNLIKEKLIDYNSGLHRLEVPKASCIVISFTN